MPSRLRLALTRRGAVLSVIAASAALVAVPASASASNHSIWDDDIHTLAASATGSTVFAGGSDPSVARLFGQTGSVLWRSTDGGGTWTQVPNPGTGVPTVLLPPTYPATPTLYAIANHTLYRSDDDAATWTPQLTGVTDGEISPGWAGGDHRVLLGSDAGSVLAYEAGTRLVKPLFTVPGATITQLSAAAGFPADSTIYVTTFAAALDAWGTNIYACDVATPVCTTTTTDTGLNFNSVHASKSDSGTLMATGADVGFEVTISTDGGSTWGGSGPAGAWVTSMIDGGPGEVLLTAWPSVGYPGDAGVYATTDSGATWSLLTAGTVATTAGAVTAARLATGELIVSVNHTSTIICSADNGTTWAATC